MLASSLAALFWAGNLIAGRALRDDADPVTLITLRWLLGPALFLPWVGGNLRRDWPVVRRELRLVVALGATGIAAFHTLVYLALAQTTAVNALLILTLAPVLIMAGAASIGQERPSPLQWAGAFVSLLGAAVLVTHGDLWTWRAQGLNLGVLWMLGAVLAWTIHSLLLRRRPRDLPQDVMPAASVLAALALLRPVLLLQGSIRFDPGLPALGALLYIAVFASIVAFRLWSFGVGEIGPAQAGRFVNLMPVFGALLAVALLGERITMAQVVGVACPCWVVRLWCWCMAGVVAMAGVAGEAVPGGGAGHWMASGAGGR